MPATESSTPTLDALLEENARQVVEAGMRVTPAALLTSGKLRNVPDEELVYVVEEQGITLHKEELAPLVEAHTTGDNVGDELCAQYGVDPMDPDAELAAIAIVELCLRWYPDWVCRERLQNLISAGYDAYQRTPGTIDDVAILEEWLAAWALVPGLAHRWRVLSIEAFDRRFAGMFSIPSWLLDFDAELSVADVKDEGYRNARIAFAREFEKTFPGELYDVLGMRIEPDGTLYSKYDQMLSDYEEDHVIPYVDALRLPVPKAFPKTSKSAATRKVGRNDPCPCGSGKKYKKCCGQPYAARR